MENVNGPQLGVRHPPLRTVHPGGPCNETTGSAAASVACPGCQTGFHTYGDRVGPQRHARRQLRWYRRRRRLLHASTRTRSTPTTWTNATNHGYFVILNVAMGGGFPAAFGGGPTAVTRSGVPMLVDYVAVYSAGGGTTPPPPTTAAAPPPTGGTGAYGTDPGRVVQRPERARSSEATTDAGGGQDIGFIANGDWASYPNVDFGCTPAHQFSARVASGAAAGSAGWSRSGWTAGPTRRSAASRSRNTGGWQSWRTVPANISAVTGVHTVFLTFTSGQPADFVNVNWFTFAPLERARHPAGPGREDGSGPRPGPVSSSLGTTARALAHGSGIIACSHRSDAESATHLTRSGAFTRWPFCARPVTTVT